MDQQDQEYVVKYNIQVHTPPILNKDSSDVFLIRHGFSQFNHKQVAIEKDGLDHDGSLIRAIKCNPDLVDPDLHPIGVYECL